MWVAKIKLLDPNCVHAPKVKAAKIQAYEHLITRYKKGKDYYYTLMILLIGTTEGKKKYIKLLRKDKHVKKIEIRGDVIVELLRKTKKEIDVEAYEAFTNPEVIFTKPGFVDSDAWEYYEIASWNRKAIEKVIKETEKYFNGVLLSLKQTDKYELYFPRFLPKLSNKQKQAISLAVKEGYYEFPRKIELKKLAKISKQSFSTFREHLRKAENKLLPLMHREFFLSQ